MTTVLVIQRSTREADPKTCSESARVIGTQKKLSNALSAKRNTLVSLQNSPYLFWRTIAFR
jgi:hypothetical protein